MKRALLDVYVSIFLCTMHTVAHVKSCSRMDDTQSHASITGGSAAASGYYCCCCFWLLLLLLLLAAAAARATLRCGYCWNRWEALRPRMTRSCIGIGNSEFPSSLVVSARRAGTPD